MAEFVAIGENENGALLEEWSNLLMPSELTLLFILKLLSLDSDTDLETSVLLIVIFCVEGK